VRLIKITDEYVKVADPTFGNKTLYRGKTYLTYNIMAERIVAAGWGEVIGNRKDLSQLPREALQWNKEAKKVLFLFSGRFGDAISFAILMNILERDYNLIIDVGCHHDLGHFILAPMGFRGKILACPVEMEMLDDYDYIQTDVTNFIADQSRKHERSIPEELAKAYGIDPSRFRGDYGIPEDTVVRMALPGKSAVRIGVCFESKGPFRSYPEAPGGKLVSDLTGIGLEVHRFGTQQAKIIPDLSVNAYHDHTGKTDVFELAALVRQMDVMVAVDSFTAHLANLLGVPTIVLLSTTAASVYRCHENVVCLPSLIPCAPCGRTEDKCPRQHQECRAFYHPSADHKVITALILRNCAELFKRRFRAA